MKNHVKGFSQFINENSRFDEEGMDLYLNPDEQDKLIADALGCLPEELESRCFVGAPNGDEDVADDPYFKEIEDLLDYDNKREYWSMARPGQIVYRINVSAPDGFQEAHYFKHNGLNVVIVNGEGGPYIFAKRDSRLKDRFGR